MPFRKKLPVLQDLCLDSIVENLEAHGERFKELREEDGKFYFFYRILKSLFTDRLLHRTLVKINEDKNIKEFLIRENVSEKLYTWPCLEFLFNEYTSCVDPFVEVAADVINRERILYFIASKCKKLTRVGNIFCSVKRWCLLEAIPHLQNLRDVQLGCIKKNDILRTILKMCPFITQLSAKSACYGDSFYHVLCKHCSERTPFVYTQNNLLNEVYTAEKNQVFKYSLCPENGACSEVGKHLQHLDITMYDQTVDGIACALQHLPLLKGFVKLPYTPPHETAKYIFPDVLAGIMTLQNAAAANGRPKIILPLTSLYLKNAPSSEEASTVSCCCPNLEAVQLHLQDMDPHVFTAISLQKLTGLHLCNLTNEYFNSVQLRGFLSRQGRRIKFLSFLFSSEDLDPALVNSILEMCCNLKELLFFKTELKIPSHNAICSLPSSLVSIKILQSYWPEAKPSSLRCFWKWVGTKNVKSFDMCKSSAKIVFDVSLFSSSFNNTEELYTYFIYLAIKYLETLDGANKILRRIRFYCCESQESAPVMYRDTSKVEVDNLHHELEWIRCFPEKIVLNFVYPSYEE